MKKTAFLLTMVLAASLTACASGAPADTGSSDRGSAEISTLRETGTVPESSTEAPETEINPVIGTWLIEYGGEQYEHIIVSDHEAYLRIWTDIAEPSARMTGL